MTVAPGQLHSLRLLNDWDMVLQPYGVGYCGPAVDPEELPLAPSTVAALWRWNRSFQELTDGPPAEALDREVDLRLLEDEGLRLWRAVQEELGPAFRVFFHSHRYGETFASLAEYEGWTRDGVPPRR